MGVVVEAANVAGERVQRFLTGMAERRVAQIVRQRHRLGQVLVGLEQPRQAARQLRHFQRMGQPGAVMVAFMLHENLGLVLEAAEGRGMDDAVAVAAVTGAGEAFGFREKATPAFPGIGGIRRQRRGRQDDVPQKTARRLCGFCGCVGSLGGL